MIFCNEPKPILNLHFKLELILYTNANKKEDTTEEKTRAYTPPPKYAYAIDSIPTMICTLRVISAILLNLLTYIVN